MPVTYGRHRFRIGCGLLQLRSQFFGTIPAAPFFRQSKIAHVPAPIIALFLQDHGNDLLMLILFQNAVETAGGPQFKNAGIIVRRHGLTQIRPQAFHAFDRKFIRGGCQPVW